MGEPRKITLSGDTQKESDTRDWLGDGGARVIYLFQGEGERYKQAR